MNWIATNIRFPEDQYMRLKQTAARERKSLAKIIREATDGVIKPTETVSTEKKKKEVEKFMRSLERLAKENSKQAGKDFNSVKALREIRYSE